MEAKETDFEYLQPPEVVAGQMDELAGGIMDMLDNPDPNHSAEVVPKKPETEPETAPETGTTEPETGTEETEEEPQKYTIKWQGQEKEVTQDELLNLAQQGFDYTKKTQSLAEERDQLAPFIGLAKKIQNDPLLASTIAAHLTGQAPPKAKTFDDPIEQLKYETKQEALAEIRQEMQQNLVPLQRQQALNQVRMQVQADPDYREVHEQIINMVKEQPPAIQRTLYAQLDQDPTAYLEAFQHFKSKKATPTKPIPVAVKRETKAPILSSGGVQSPDSAVSQAKAQKLSKQKASALRSGDPIAIAEWMQASGALDHLY